MKIFALTLGFFFLLGTTYSKPTGSCNGKTSFRAKNMTLVGFADDIVTAKDIEDCAGLCIDRGARCQSGMFFAEQKAQNCILNSESRQTKAEAYEAGSTEAIEYFEPCQRASNGSSGTEDEASNDDYDGMKILVGATNPEDTSDAVIAAVGDVQNGSDCAGGISFRAANRTLVGSADNVTSAKDIEECAKLCGEKPGCLSGMFYPENKESNCILNTQSRQTKPDMYQPEKQDFIEYFEPCQKSESAQMPSSTPCNGVLAFRAVNHTLVGSADNVTSAKDIEECAKKCAEKSGCLSGMFYSQQKEANCILNTQNRLTKAEVYQHESQDSVEYFEPCQKAPTASEPDVKSAGSDSMANSNTSSCTGTVATRIPSHILVGFGDNVTSAATVEECASLCLSSTSPRCKSGMFYAKEKKSNCILNTENRATKPDQFVEEKVDDVEYFEPCQHRRF